MDKYSETFPDDDTIYFGDIVTYTCHPGFFFPGGLTLRTAECTDDFWEEEIPDCEGYITHIIKTAMITQYVMK